MIVSARSCFGRKERTEGEGEGGLRLELASDGSLDEAMELGLDFTLLRLNTVSGVGNGSGSPTLWAGVTGVSGTALMPDSEIVGSRCLLAGGSTIDVSSRTVPAFSPEDVS